MSKNRHERVSSLTVNLVSVLEVLKEIVIELSMAT